MVSYFSILKTFGGHIAFENGKSSVNFFQLFSAGKNCTTSSPDIQLQFPIFSTIIALENT